MIRFIPQLLAINVTALQHMVAFFFFVLVGACQTNAQVNVTLQTTPPLCGGFSTGSITANPTGGTSPYSYLWSNGGTTQTINNLPQGAYSVTVTDDIGNTASATTTLLAPPPLQATINVLNCGIPGVLSVDASGGVQPLEYEWSNGATTPTIANLTAGEYCITVADQNSCAFVTCQTIGPLITIEVETTPTICGSGTGGTATANISGGVAPFQILWNTGETTATIEDLLPGVYTVTVISVNGCFAEASGEVVLGPGNFETELEVTNATCEGQSNGAITANPSGGIAPYTYEWTSPDTTQSINNLAAGIYSLTVTDAIGCTSTASTVVTYESFIDVTVVGVNPTCGSSMNGSISAFPSGGVTPYEYLWNTGDTSQMIPNAGEGNYSVIVTDSVGCVDSASTTLIAPPSFNVNMGSTNASQCGASDGSASATPIGGGSPPFSYLWNNGATSNNLNNIPAGTYEVTVTDGNGCTGMGSTTVEQPTILEVEITGSTTICPNSMDGILTAEVTYGNAPYEFEWSNGDSTQTISNLSSGGYAVTVTSAEGCTGSALASINSYPAPSLELLPQNLNCFGNNSGQVSSNILGGTAPFDYLWNNGATDPTINNIPAGEYSLTVTDGNGCTTEMTTEVTQPDDITIQFSTTGSCGANGSATADVNGGTPIYSFLWSNGETTSGIFGLAPGNYSLTVTDANGCTEIQTANVPAFPLVESDVFSTNTTCNGTTDGTVTAEVNNGTAPFSYQWSNGSTQSMQTGLTPGNYSVTVTDDNSCQAFGSAFVALGAGLNVSIDAPTYACPGEDASATANASGGMGTFTYEWSNGETSQTINNLNPGSYTVTVSDPSNCTGTSTVFILPGGMYEIESSQENIDCFGEMNGSISLELSGGAPPFNTFWSNGAVSQNIENLPAGNYSVTVSDQSECEQILDFEITEPTELELELNGQNGICGNLGSALAIVNGGTIDYQYLWSNGSTESQIENLDAGTYSLTVSDASSCTISSSIEIEVTPLPTCSIDLTQVITSVNGNDGQLSCSVTGGSMPYEYLWSNGQTEPTATDLIAGNYSATVTDADGCEAICDFTLLNPSKLGNFVWLDEDMNGIQGVSEDGYEGVEINLTGEDDYGNSINETAFSDADGMYLFNTQPGTYKLTASLPNDFIWTAENVGDDNLDNDINGLTNMTPDIILNEGEENLSIDIGLFESPCENVTDPGSICCDQTLCGPGLIPDALTEATPPSGGVGPIEYLWMFTTVPGPFDPATWIPISSANAPEYTPGAISETTYFVRCVRREGCALFLESNQITITVDDDAVAEISGPDTTCVNEPIDFEAATNPSPATYSWTFADGIPATSVEQNVEGVFWTSFGVKTVTLTVENNGCISHDTLLVNVSNSPTFCGNELVISAELIAPTTVEISWDYEISDTAGLNFQAMWALNQSDFLMLGPPDSAVKNGNIWSFKKRHEEPVRGSNFYRVFLEDENGEIIFSNVVGIIIEGNGGNLVEVFPNPFSDKLKVDVINRFEADISLDIYDTLGREVYKFELPEEGNYFEIPTSDFSSGTYFLFIRYNGSPQKIFKLIK